MINSKTTLVLGAGASFPYGFPLGSNLVKEIVSLFPFEIYKNMGKNRGFGNEDIFLVLRDLGFDDSLMYEFAFSLKMSDLYSIDSFLSIEKNSKFRDIGKVLIAYVIHKYEDMNTVLHTNNWYTILWNALKANDLDGFKKNTLGIITYNYDRSLEFYLMNRIQYTYGLDVVKAYKLLKEVIEIVHVHGSLGEFDVAQLDKYGNSCVHNFGSRIHYFGGHEKLKIMGESIKVIYDGEISKSQELFLANNLLEQSERICFLGFGFADENMSKLKLDLNKDIAASAYLLTDKEVDRIFTKYFMKYQSVKRVFNQNAECHEFLRHHFLLN